MRPNQPRFKKGPPKSRDRRNGNFAPPKKSEGRDGDFKPREKRESQSRDFKPREGFKPRDGFKPRHKPETRDSEFKPRDRGERRDNEFKPRRDSFKPRHKPEGRDFKPRFKKEPRVPVDTSAMRLFGLHAVVAAWVNPKRQIKRALFTAGGRKQMEQAMQRAAKAGIARPKEEVVEGHVIDKHLARGAVHQGIMIDVEELPEFSIDNILKEEAGPGFVVVLDQVTDPHNVGAVLRSACAFGAKAVLMTDRHASASTGTLAKSASGALDNIPLVRITNLAQTLAELQQAGYWCIGLAEEGKRNLSEIKMPPRVALVLGAEGDGLRRLTRESCDEIARLPTGGPVGSLNISNAAAVAIYEVCRQKA